MFSTLKNDYGQESRFINPTVAPPPPRFAETQNLQTLLYSPPRGFAETQILPTLLYSPPWVCRNTDPANPTVAPRGFAETQILPTLL